MNRMLPLVPTAALLLCGADGALIAGTAPAPLAFTVNTAADTPDTNPTDGLCADAAGNCSFRAALQESAGAPRIVTFAVQGAVQYGDDIPALADDSTIDGGGAGVQAAPGAAATLALGERSVLKNLNLSGIDVWLVGSDNTVTGCQILDAGRGITVDGHGNRIGGAAAGERNVISGHEAEGIRIDAGSAAVLGNYIGTDATGTVARPNRWGVVIEPSANLPAGSSVIGGDADGEGNLISGNRADGIRVTNPSFDGERMFVAVTGNRIGTDAPGEKALPNGGGGVVIFGPTSGRIEDNLISGNRLGISLVGGTYFSRSPRAFDISGNIIGAGADGQTAIPNRGHGVLLTGGCNKTRIGADRRGRGVGNVIAYNSGDGIRLTGSPPFTPEQNTIRLNRMGGNGGAGIRILKKRTQGRIQPPRLLRVSGGRARGTARPGQVVDIYVADRDPSGSGEGVTHVGSGEAGADGRFSIVLAGISPGDRLTATATDRKGNTSEFARNRRVP